METNENELTGYEEHMASLPDDSIWDGYDRGDLDYVDYDHVGEAGEYEMGRILADDWMPGEITMWHAVSVMMIGFRTLVEYCQRADFKQRCAAGEILF